MRSTAPIKRLLSMFRNTVMRAKPLCCLAHSGMYTSTWAACNSPSGCKERGFHRVFRTPAIAQSAAQRHAHLPKETGSKTTKTSPFGLHTVWHPLLISTAVVYESLRHLVGSPSGCTAQANTALGQHAQTTSVRWPTGLSDPDCRGNNQLSAHVSHTSPCPTGV